MSVFELRNVSFSWQVFRVVGGCGRRMSGIYGASFPRQPSRGVTCIWRILQGDLASVPQAMLCPHAHTARNACPDQTKLTFLSSKLTFHSCVDSHPVRATHAANSWHIPQRGVCTLYSFIDNTRKELHCIVKARPYRLYTVYTVYTVPVQCTSDCSHCIS